MPQTKIAIFDLTGCEGCQFHMLSLNELLMDLFQDFEITNWRLLAPQKKSDFDIAIIEGAATTQEHIKLLKEIRETSKYVVAIGACAINGNVFAQIPKKQRSKLAAKIYGPDYQLKAKFLEPVEKFIKVDANVPGCPPDMKIFKKLMRQYQTQKVTSKIKSVVTPDYVAKIEGHGTLEINFKEKAAEFKVEESERLVEGLLLGKNFRQAPFINARICGICPMAHNICSWAAIEQALKIQSSQETIALRRMLLAAQTIKSHVLHLFFLVLPDYAQTKGAAELAQKYPAEFHLMLNLKRVADKTLEVVGGTNAFPTQTALGGFLTPPKWSGLMRLRSSIDEVLDEAQDLIKLFADLESPEVKSDTRLAAITPVDQAYPLYPGKTSGAIKEIVKIKSTAKIGLAENGDILKVGALARIAKFREKLNPQARQALENHPLDLTNPYHNNLAQAVEILHFLEEISRLIGQLKEKNLAKTRAIRNPPLPSKLAWGKAYLEAPRGILIHQVVIDPKGEIKDYNIIPPTQINLASLEKDAQELLNKDRPSPRTVLGARSDLEKLIRAFDPCITCAVH